MFLEVSFGGMISTRFDLDFANDCTSQLSHLTCHPDGKVYVFNIFAQQYHDFTGKHIEVHAQK